MKRSLSLTLAALIASSCAPGLPAVGPSEPDGSPVSGGRVIEGTFADPKTLAPFLASDAVSQSVSALVYDGLLRVDAKTGEARPNLGRWTVSPDGLTYRWQLEPGAIWSDGRPIVAEDYLTAVRAIARSKKSGKPAGLQEVVGFDEYRSGAATAIRGITVDPLDPRSFAVHFRRVFCPALHSAFGPAASPLPTHIYGRYLEGDDAAMWLDRAPENTAPPVSSGPFVFKSWRQGQELVLARNDYYFRGVPYLDEYVLRVVSDTTSLAAQLRAGELHIGAVEPKDFAQLTKHPRLRGYSFQELSYHHIGWNTKSASTPALGDARVRQALAHGLDMNAVVQQVLDGQAVRVYQHHLHSSWASADPGTLQLYQYDRRRAEDLLAKAGFARAADGYFHRDGKRLELTIVTNSGNRVREAVLQATVDQYRQIGVKVNPRLQPFDAMVDSLSTRSADVSGWIIAWKLPIDPDPYSIWHSTAVPDPAQKTTGYNFGAFASAEIDRLIESARTPPGAAGCAQGAREKAYETLNRLLNEEQPYNFGFSPLTLFVAVRQLRGFAPGTYATHGGVEKWWLSR